MSPCGSTIRGGKGEASGVASGGGGVTCGGGATLLNISASCLRASVSLSPNVVSGLVGVGLRRKWVSSAAACVATYFD